MSLAIVYNLRHILNRKASNIMTLLGIALVVFVYTVTMMLSEGLKKTLASTGSPNNVIALRVGAQNEIQSGIPRDQANIILSQPEVARLSDGTILASTDTVVLKSLKKRSDNAPSNVNMRGVGRLALQLREGISITQGRAPTPGTKELIIGSAIYRKFSNTEIGKSLRIVGTEWPIVGIFDAGNSAFSSEIWGDVDVLMPAFKRDRYSSVTFRFKEGSDFSALQARLENDRQLTVSVKRENEFYAAQSQSLAQFISMMGQFVSIIFSLGAIIGAMITMYSAVAHRTREIGILRAIGFSSSAVLWAFIKECLVIALAGGVLGVSCAASMSLASISTTNFATFSEVQFGFMISVRIVIQALLFACLMGLIGGAFPAYRAGKIKILEALRAV